MCGLFSQVDAFLDDERRVRSGSPSRQTENLMVDDIKFLEKVLPPEIRQTLHASAEEHFERAWALLRAEVAVDIIALLRISVTVWDREGNLKSNNGNAQVLDFGVAEGDLKGLTIQAWDKEYPGCGKGFVLSQHGEHHFSILKAKKSNAEFVVWWLPAKNGRKYTVSLAVPAEIAPLLLPPEVLSVYLP